MNFYFTQLYTTVNASFGLATAFVHELCQSLDLLNKSIPALEKKYKTSDFELGFSINATLDPAVILDENGLRERYALPITELRVKGPTYVRGKKDVYFVPYIPFKDVNTFEEEATHVLHYLELAVLAVFEFYKADSDGIHETFKRVLEKILANPDAYQAFYTRTGMLIKDNFEEHQVFYNSDGKIIQRRGY